MSTPGDVVPSRPASSHPLFGLDHVAGDGRGRPVGGADWAAGPICGYGRLAFVGVMLAGFALGTGRACRCRFVEPVHPGLGRGARALVALARCKVPVAARRGRWSASSPCSMAMRMAARSRRPRAACPTWLGFAVWRRHCCTLGVGIGFGAAASAADRGRLVRAGRCGLRGARRRAWRSACRGLADDPGRGHHGRQARSSSTGARRR